MIKSSSGDLLAIGDVKFFDTIIPKICAIWDRLIYVIWILQTSHIYLKGDCMIIMR